MSVRDIALSKMAFHKMSDPNVSFVFFDSKGYYKGYSDGNPRTTKRLVLSKTTEGAVPSTEYTGYDLTATTENHLALKKSVLYQSVEDYAEEFYDLSVFASVDTNLNYLKKLDSLLSRTHLQTSWEYTFISEQRLDVLKVKGSKFDVLFTKEFALIFTHNGFIKLHDFYKSMYADDLAIALESLIGLSAKTFEDIIWDVEELQEG